MIPDFILKQLLSPQNVKNVVAGLVGKVKEMQRRDGCQYEMVIRIANDDVEANVYRRVDGKPVLSDRYTSANIDELLKAAMNGK